jgi:DNA polymerase-3 subunit beta
MKVICDRGVLADALSLVQSVVVSRTPKPVLLCVKLSASDGVLTLSGTDLEVALRLTVDQVDVQADGEVLVPADKLTGIVRESVDPTITIEADQEAANIQGADSHFKVFGHVADEFPPISGFEGEPDFEIAATELKKLIQQTIFATARETSRYAINGVLMERDGKKLMMVATDGRRLAQSRGICSKGAGDVTSPIVPSKALSRFQKILTDDGAVVRGKIDANQAHVATGRATMTTNMVEGNFPPYKDVIPKNQTTKATFKSAALASGVRRAALLTNEESKGVRFHFGKEELVLASRAPEMGESEVKVPIDGFSGDEVEIGFNPYFVADVLKVVDAEEVTFELKAANKPGTLRFGPDFLYVVMPVSLG